MRLTTNSTRPDTIIPYTTLFRSLLVFDIGVHVRVRMGNDLEACRNAGRPELALYVGGMGARDKNFYNDYMKRLGFEDAAQAIQDRFLSGDRKGAAAAVDRKRVV